MKLVFLGTSAAQPTEDRALSCICLEREGEVLMFDAGEGAQVSYLKSGLGWNKKMKIFVTHMHGDHCIGILGLLQTMTLQHRTESIEIYGPDGIEQFIGENIRILQFGLSFPVIITAVSPGLVCEEKSYLVYAQKAEHSVLAFSYRFEEKDKPGKFDRETAIRLGIPEGPLWHDLQTGKEVKIGDNIFSPSQVVGEKRPGKKIGISGDTRPTKLLEEFFKNCDYLSFDCTFSDTLRDKAIDTNHSTAKEAATLAKNANVANLILTHFSARHKDEDELAKEARTIHDSVIAAKDLLEIEIK
ncbi:MAG: ribonuclease Z [Nitrososphaeria archaeon]|nr:ribonuclease Z [Nitrososphaeria archaeon]NDB51124.1 ribonuclease Z [Nitrosopumilaceae archaeon]NDB87834.1 ribonuclease Z [Nitrososphaerota archaeon]NDB89753.1 ribonuclease Z [Nitrososphaerota archaeon]NDB91140.1 ribonuclease Z [Nitrososphaeria archaeon]